VSAIRAVSPIVLVLLLAAAAAATGTAALLTARRTYRQLAALRAELASRHLDATAAPAVIPAARRAPPADEIRIAVAAALADERERELGEARAFWAAQEDREAAGAPVLDLRDPREPADPRSAGPAESGEFEVSPYFPHPVDIVGLEPGDPAAAGRGLHPCDPDFVPSPVVADPERIVAQLAALAEARTPLTDIRTGPLGSLDLYVFADGATLCLTPGHRETAERLAEAMERGDAPVLLGGSGISGAFALTFTCGEESVFVLADRVVTSL
jgi:hypothetical protein